jgi:D-alanyl-lipoteichoic acid acyltransferase DltB (MBOAT superfamily)
MPMQSLIIIDMNSLSLILGAVFLPFKFMVISQATSDMALGMSKLFGIDLLKILITLIFSRDIAEFWRRWHIRCPHGSRLFIYPTRRQ